MDLMQRLAEDFALGEVLDIDLYRERGKRDTASTDNEEVKEVEVAGEMEAGDMKEIKGEKARARGHAKARRATPKGDAKASEGPPAPSAPRTPEPTPGSPLVASVDRRELAPAPGPIAHWLNDMPPPTLAAIGQARNSDWAAKRLSRRPCPATECADHEMKDLCAHVRHMIVSTSVCTRMHVYPTIARFRPSTTTILATTAADDDDEIAGTSATTNLAAIAAYGRCPTTTTGDLRPTKLD